MSSAHDARPDDPALATPGATLARACDWLRGPGGVVVLALIVGIGAGLGAVAFRYLIHEFTLLFSGRPYPSTAGRVANPLVPGLGIWFLVAAPVAGGLIYGPLVERFAREARGHGVPEVMLAVAERGGRIKPAVVVVKALASALCIGSGGSVGREGPIVQIGSALASTVGQVARVPESRLRLLVACGAAGGIAATFNAPIAGVFFALELILRDFETRAFGAVVIASVTADIIGRAAFGSHAFLALPHFALGSLWDYLLYLGLGLIAAFVGSAFIRVLYGFEDLADRIWRGPESLRPAVGGVALGLLLLALPELYGVGYPVLENAIRGDYVLWLLLLLLAGKLVATSLTIAIGGSGGVFAPSLFMGAMLGSAYGALAHDLLPAIAGTPGAYGLLGMGAVFAAAARAPITAVLIIFELTGNYTVILPLMFAVVVATTVGGRLSHETIYTLKLRRRGINLRRGRAANLMQTMVVGDAMRPVPQTTPDDARIADLVALFTADGHDALAVVDRNGAFRGVLAPEEIEQALRDNALDATAGELARTAPTVRADQSLEKALEMLVAAEAPGLPVLDAASERVVGWLTHRDVLRAYHERLQRGRASMSPARPEPDRDGTSKPAPRTPRGALSGYRIVELELPRGAPLAGAAASATRWPPGTALIGLRRGDDVLPATASATLGAGDRLSFLVSSERADELTAELARAILTTAPAEAVVEAGDATTPPARDPSAPSGT